MMEFEKVAVALRNLKEAWLECASAFNEVDEGELNEMISDNYPFHKSFDEMTLDVAEWTRESRINIYTKDICTKEAK